MFSAKVRTTTRKNDPHVRMARNWILKADTVQEGYEGIHPFLTLHAWLPPFWVNAHTEGRLMGVHLDELLSMFVDDLQTGLQETTSSR